MTGAEEKKAEPITEASKVVAALADPDMDLIAERQEIPEQ